MASVLALIAAIVAAPLQSPGCPIDRAVYRHQGAPQFTAGFARQDRRKSSGSDLAFWLKTPLRTYWFALGAPNGYGGTYITPEIDPARSSASPEPLDPPRSGGADELLTIDIDAFGADLAPFKAPPQSSDKAPALIFSRELGGALWYDWVSLAAGDPAAQREALPIGFFKPAGCRKG